MHPALLLLFPNGADTLTGCEASACIEMLHFQNLIDISHLMNCSITPLRRSAILSFLSRLPPDETCHLTHLMLRGVLPQAALLSAATALSKSSESDTTRPAHMSLTDRSDLWYSAVTRIAESMTVHEIGEVAWERQIGFLHLLEQTVRLVGFGVTEQVGVLLKVVLAMLSGSQTGAWTARNSIKDAAHTNADDEVNREADGNEVEDDEMDVEGGGVEPAAEGNVAVHHRDANQASKVRSLSLLRLSEMVHQFHGTYSFVPLRKELLSPLGGLIAALPGAVTGSSKPPGLLRLLSAFVRYDETVGVVVPPIPVAVAAAPVEAQTSKAKKVKGSKKGAVMEVTAQPMAVEGEADTGGETDLIVQTLIKCVAARADFGVSRMVMDVLSILLEREDGRAILPHAHLIIRCFSKRFVGPDFDETRGVSAQLKLSEMRIAPTGSVKQGEAALHFDHAMFSYAVSQSTHLTTNNPLYSLELKLLCRIAERIFSRGDVALDPVSVSNLATLLLGMLRTYTTSRKVRVEEEWVLDILRIYRSLLWRMEDVTPHIAFIGRLFGPSGKTS
jgi:Down-regulated in metastasis